MDRAKLPGILLIVAATAFLIAALLDQPPNALRLLAAAALYLAGIMRLRRPRRS